MLTSYYLTVSVSQELSNSFYDWFWLGVFHGDVGRMLSSLQPSSGFAGERRYKDGSVHDGHLALVIDGRPPFPFTRASPECRGTRASVRAGGRQGGMPWMN